MKAVVVMAVSSLSRNGASAESGSADIELLVNSVQFMVTSTQSLQVFRLFTTQLLPHLTSQQRGPNEISILTDCLVMLRDRRIVPFTVSAVRAHRRLATGYTWG